MKTIKKILKFTVIMSLLMFTSIEVTCQGMSNKEPILKLNLKDLRQDNGLYYHNDELYTGSFYNIYSTKGPNAYPKNGFVEGMILEGQREGEWKWYADNMLSTVCSYKDGEMIINNDEKKIYSDNDGQLYKYGKKIYLRKE